MNPQAPITQLNLTNSMLIFHLFSLCGFYFILFFCLHMLDHVISLAEASICISNEGICFHLTTVLLAHLAA